MHLVSTNIIEIGHELAVPFAHQVNGVVTVAHQWVVDDALIVPDGDILVKGLDILLGVLLYRRLVARLGPVGIFFHHRTKN